MSLRALLVSLRRRARYRRCLAAASGVVVLRYHSVGEPSEVAEYLDPGLSLPPERFREQVRTLARSFTIVPIGDVPRLMRERAGGRRYAAITFDDGYRDNHDVALPILREEGAVAAFYVTTDPIRSGHGLWISELFRLVRQLPAGPLGIDGLALDTPGVDAVPAEASQRTPLRRALTRHMSGLRREAREALLDALASRAGVARGEGLAASFMTPEHIVALRRAGMVVGAHTRSHPHLDMLDEAHHDDEIRGSKAALEEILGEPVQDFAYPNPGAGKGVSPTARRSVERCGFETAVTSVTAPLGADADPLRLPRIGVYAGVQEGLLFRVLGNVATTASP